MTWFFAILAVLLMAGVAAVAAGRGGSLPEEYDDRPDVRVPNGPLTGEDVRRVRFTLAFRGYRMTEVDALLERLAAQLDDRHSDHDGERDGDHDDERDVERDVDREPVREGEPRGEGSGD